ncbi:MAG: hypothetical protein EYC62_02490 [Alphaproteobacteria bacterium]|nr:MAG: hypothetical protein EYC62_02490 [Alphaproteobacteria bacterium]
MPWNGSGIYTRLRNWVTDKNNGIKIVASLHDQEDDNLAAGIQACLTKNNESKPTADFKPHVDATYNLGSASLRWLQAFVSGGVRLFNGATNYGDLQTGPLTATRTYTLPDYSGNVVLQDGTQIIRESSGAAFKNSGYESVLQPQSLSAARTVVIPDSSGTIILDSAMQDISNKTFAPDGVGAGQAGAIRLKELATNGTEQITFRAPDAIGTGYSVTLPNIQGSAGTTLTNDGTGLLTWQSPGSTFGSIGINPGDAGRIQLQELAANGVQVVRVKAPDSITASFDLTMPNALPSTAGAGLSFTTGGVASFTSSPMATRQHADESALIFSLLQI